MFFVNTSFDNDRGSRSSSIDGRLNAIAYKSLEVSFVLTASFGSCGHFLTCYSINIYALTLDIYGAYNFSIFLKGVLRQELHNVPDLTVVVAGMAFDVTS